MKPIVIKSFGQILKLKGFKVSKVEEDLGLSAGYFSRITNYEDISFKVAYKLSKFLDVSMENLYDLLCEVE